MAEQLKNGDIIESKSGKKLRVVDVKNKILEEVPSSGVEDVKSGISEIVDVIKRSAGLTLGTEERSLGNVGDILSKGYTAQSKIMAPGSRVGQVAQQNLIGGATLGNYVPETEAKGAGEQTVALASNIMGQQLPYSIGSGAINSLKLYPTMATSLKSLASINPAIANIIESGAKTGIVGGFRPAKDLEDRIMNIRNEFLMGAVPQALGEGSKFIKDAIKNKTLPMIASKLGIQSKKDMLKAVNNPDYYARKAEEAVTENARNYAIAEKASAAVDDVINLRATELEDNVIKKLAKEGYDKTRGLYKGVSLKSVLSTGYQSLDDAVREGRMSKDEAVALSEQMPKIIDNFMSQAKKRAVPGIPIKGKGTKGYFDIEEVIPIEEAHKLKQEIYRIARKSYGATQNNSYSQALKDMARKINTTIGEYSPEYREANKKLQVIYDIDDELANKGFAYWDQIGGGGKIKALMNDIKGRKLLKAVDAQLPDSKKFFYKLEDYRKTQNIRSKFYQPGAATAKTVGSLAGGSGGAAFGGAMSGPAGVAVGSTIGGIGGYLGGGLTTGPMLSTASRVLNTAPFGGKGIPAQTVPILINAILETDNQDKKGLK